VRVAFSRSALWLQIRAGWDRLKAPCQFGNQWRVRSFRSNYYWAGGHGKAHMSRVALLFSRRVPLRIWLPVVIACAAVGFVASTLRSIRPTPSTPHIFRSEGSSQTPGIASPVEVSPRTAHSQLSRALGPPRDIPSIALPTEKEDLPTPAPPPMVAERNRPVSDEVGKSVPAGPATKGTSARARGARNDHVMAKARRPQRTAQQPVKASSTSSAGLKNVPIIGPLFSMFQ
jgi:hypothetical protein